MIMHDDKVITDPYDVANIMNDFYFNIANQISDDSNMIFTPYSHRKL